HTKDTVSIKDKSSTVIKKRPNSSLVKGIQLLKENKVDAFVSAGHTGAIMSASLLLLGRIKGIKRPALAAYLPIGKRGKVLCDVGANPDAKPEHLLQSSIMASNYYSYVENFPNPKIGLINIGSEPNKGSELYQETYKLLTKTPKFIGNIEGRNILTSEADVLICDGFVGNTLLKFAESWVGTFTDEIKSRMDEKISFQVGSKLMKPIFKDLQKRYDYEEHGGTPLLGVNGISIVCHGSSGPKSIMNSIFLAQRCIKNDLLKSTQENISNYSK
ncbi:MAG: phosphate--acyl-ACP acyltransferase, partial [Candidatus Marinimicrobia bacterium]|nr:phosphate--acyl-ACP acyltransferase [Candidatus Neomarinimicrobiota bacterium]